MKEFNVSIKGLCPILHARHPTPEEEAKITKLKDTKGKKRDLSEQEKFDIHAYITNEGKFYQPSEMIEAAMVKAGTAFKLEGKKTYKDLMKGGIIVEPERIIHSNQKGFAFKNRNAQWGKNPNTRGAVWVVRPKCDDWELSFTIKLLQDERVEVGILKQILEYAGNYVGIGAWRPKFGRFKVTKFDEIE